MDVLAVELPVGQLGHLAHRVGHDHLFEAVGVRIAGDRQERRQAGAGGDQEQALAGLQGVHHQGAGGLLADQDLVAGLDVLEP